MPKCQVLLIAAAWTCLTAGCAELRFATHMPGMEPMRLTNRPRIQIDREASMLALHRTSAGDELAEASRIYQREDLFGAIESFWNRGLPEGRGQPARVAIIGMNRDFNAPWIATQVLLFFWVLGLGWPTMQYDADIRLVIELHDGHRQEAWGTGTCYAGIFYPGDPEPCALSKAITAALRSLEPGGGGT